MHSCINDEIKSGDEFNGELFFSYERNKLIWGSKNFYGSKTIEQTNKISNKLERILLTEATIDDTVFILINIYNANTKLEQLEVC